MNQRQNDIHAMTMAGLNLIQQALSIYDSDLRLVVCNQRFRDMFHLPDELITPGASFGETIYHLTSRGEYGPVDDIDGFVQGRIELALTFEPHYLEREMSNGRWISVEGSPLPGGGWVAVYTDITRAKKQEKLLRARSAELSDQVLANSEELSAANRKLAATVTALEETKRQLTAIEARTRLTTEMMPAHIAHVDTDLRYTYSNRRLSSVMPGQPSNILGLHAKEALGDAAYIYCEPHLERALRGVPSVFEFTHDTSARRIRVSFTPDQNQGEIQGVYILSMDVTEETQARTALQQTKRREMGAQLTSGMAHDFSNLLTIILGTQSRLQRMDLPPEVSELVAATLSAAQRGGSLLNQIADITGAREWDPVPTDIGAFMADLETLARSALPNSTALSVDCDLNGTVVMLDSGMMKDSLLNLVLNARDASQGKGHIAITVRPLQDTWLEFIVNDDGPGFSETALRRALEPFFTTKGSEGSGLGLSMVYDMVKLAGGRVKIGNRDGKGGQVTLRLPFRAANAPRQPGLVLLVEDSPDLRITVREMLTDAGHSVIEAASVPEALTLFEELPDISLVLSDISLEGEATGADLIAQLPAQACPVFLMTSLPPDHPDHKRAALQAPVLRKPFTAAQLAAFLQQDIPQ